MLTAHSSVHASRSHTAGSNSPSFLGIKIALKMIYEKLQCNGKAFHSAALRCTGRHRRYDDDDGCSGGQSDGRVSSSVRSAAASRCVEIDDEQQRDGQCPVGAHCGHDLAAVGEPGAL